MVDFLLQKSSLAIKYKPSISIGNKVVEEDMSHDQMTCQVTTRQDMCDHITCHQIIGHYCDYKTCPMITGDVLRCLVIRPCMTIAHAYSAQAWRLDPLLEIDPGPPR